MKRSALFYFINFIYMEFIFHLYFWRDVRVALFPALTVILVGLVNSGIMHFGRTVGIIMGANIGTTVTAWLLSMIGI